MRAYTVCLGLALGILARMLTPLRVCLGVVFLAIAPIGVLGAVGVAIRLLSMTPAMWADIKEISV
jgi:hypothetical protein